MLPPDSVSEGASSLLKSTPKSERSTSSVTEASAGAEVSAVLNVVSIDSGSSGRTEASSISEDTGKDIESFCVSSAAPKKSGAVSALAPSVSSGTGGSEKPLSRKSSMETSSTADASLCACSFTDEFISEKSGKSTSKLKSSMLSDF